MSNIFLSIFVATCRPDNVVKFLDNLAETADDLSSFEVLLKVDDDDQKSIETLQAYQKHAKFSVKYLGTEKLEGYYSLDVGYNELLKIADPSSYFCWLLTDEIRLETKGWDTILKKYISFYKDDIFRIKLSVFQLKNYYDFFESLPMPDNYAVTTRKWLEITGGWGHFWGPDSWHQCVDYYLGKNKNQFNPHGIWRSFPIYDIKVGGQEAGQGYNEASLRKRAKMIWLGWCKFSTHAAQENFSRLAARLNAHIYAIENGLQGYLLKDDTLDKTISIYHADGKKKYETWAYKIPKAHLKLYIGEKQIYLRNLLPQINVLIMTLVYYRNNFFKKMKTKYKKAYIAYRYTKLFYKKYLRRSSIRYLLSRFAKKKLLSAFIFYKQCTYLYLRLYDITLGRIVEHIRDKKIKQRESFIQTYVYSGKHLKEVIKE